MPHFAEVALHMARLQGTFTYHLSPELHPLIRPGHLVVVPFGRRRAQGIVLRLTDDSPVPETRPVESLVERDPVLTPAQLDLAAWISHATRTPIGECASFMLPAGLGQHADEAYELVDPSVTPPQGTSTLLVDLLRRRGPMRGRQIQRALPHRDWRGAARSLVQAGVVRQTAVLEMPRVRPRLRRTARLAVAPEAAQERMADVGRGGAAERRRSVLQALLAETDPVDVTWLYAEAGAKPGDLTYLEDKGLIAFDSTEAVRDPLADVVAPPPEPPKLTAHQAAVWQTIQEALLAPAGTTYLVHGVTGSGKTEIYLRAVDQVLRSGESAIVLVPEISLTPQTVQRFVSRFGDRVGVLHSGLGIGERYDTWRRARTGDLSVIIGPRSALFAPLPRLRLLVVDEEHDESFKEQERAPRFHARDAAMAYARLVQGVCLLGSATPDVVTYHRAKAGQIRLLELPRRVLAHREAVLRQQRQFSLPAAYQPLEGDAMTIDLPPVHVVDMRQELKAGNTSLFSRRLERALADALEARQQTILFLNRRGSATYVFCRDCGWTARCPRCETPLIHHPSAENLRCHHCGYQRRAPSRCTNCGGSRVRYFGAGTQRIQAEVETRFPGVRTLRWDWDVTRRKGAHEVILAHFAAHRADVLIGTQMLAKGLDLPLVTLVGIISADTGLHLPDYRSGERTFQVLTQVAGRAGRGPAGGQVVLQTYHPEHEVVRAAAAHDYVAFFAAELHHRRNLGYPPFRRLVRLVFRTASVDAAQRESARVARRLQREAATLQDPPEILGPTPCFFSRVRGLSRWQILLRGRDPVAVVPPDLPEGWAVDVDPVSLL